ncbi:MAG: hypothetical protein RIQ65_195 [Pseudomonadota bacterium]
MPFNYGAAMMKLLEKNYAQIKSNNDELPLLATIIDDLPGSYQISNPIKVQNQWWNNVSKLLIKLK